MREMMRALYTVASIGSVRSALVPRYTRVRAARQQSVWCDDACTCLIALSLPYC